MSLGLLGAYHSSDSSDSSDSEDAPRLPSASATLEAGATAPQAAAAPKLSNPFMASTAAEKYKPSYMVSQKDFHNTELKPGTTKPVSDSSVFSNPFRAKEDRKKAILERHVDMTDKQEDQKKLFGKKPCWNFRKGRCRTGSKCPYAHDNDVNVKEKEDANSAPSSANKEQFKISGGTDKQLLQSAHKEWSGQDPNSKSSQKPYAVVQLGTQQSDPDPPAPSEESPAVISHNKRKRPGLSDGLTPSKKASKFYNQVYGNKP